MDAAEQRWQNLPEDLVQNIKLIARLDRDGLRPRRFNSEHLTKQYPDENQPIVWVLGRLCQAGTVYGHGKWKVSTLEIHVNEVFLQGDWNRASTSVDQKGQYDPSISVTNMDVCPVNIKRRDEKARNQRPSGTLKEAAKIYAAALFLTFGDLNISQKFPLMFSQNYFTNSQLLKLAEKSARS